LLRNGSRLYQTTRSHIAGDSTLQSYLIQERYENKHRNKDLQQEVWEKQTKRNR
jgi:hypothetical protein